MSTVDTLTLKQLKTILERTAGEADWGQREAECRDMLQSSSTQPELANYLTELNLLGKKRLASPRKPLLFSEFIRFGTDGNRASFEAAYFERRENLSLWTMLYLAEQDEAVQREWLEALQNLIWEICNEYTWVLPAHVGLYVNEYPDNIWNRPLPPRDNVDLFTAETAFALAEVVTMLQERLHPWVTDRVWTEINKRVFVVYYGDPAPQNWEMKTNNWPAVCAAGAGGAALYGERDSEKLAGMIWRTLQSLRAHLSGFDEDGATPEGVMYWQYGFGYYVYFAELLKRRTRGEIDLLDGEKIARISRFSLACILSQGQTVNFSDAPSYAELSKGLFAKLCESVSGMYNPAEPLRVDGLSRCWIAFSRNAFWTLSAVPSKQAAVTQPTEGQRLPLREDYHFKGHQWVISKRLTGGKLAVFAAKGGSNSEPHNHNDLGHFIIHVDGTSTLADLGAGEYTRQYFQPQYRYGTWLAGSKGHSVPMIDGQGQPHGNEYCAEELLYEQEGAAVRYSLDLTKAYSCSNLSRLVRSFEWLSEGDECTLKLRDKVNFQNVPASFEEVFISAVEPAGSEGAIQLDQLLLSYDQALWQLSWEQHEVSLIHGAKRFFWRLSFQPRELKSEMSAEFHFHINRPNKPN
ncbi:hypothetical protein EBB07_01940 [Paenibacillaceae bacterium]|nr:hypothetical protein EBB07_01940 [Paenibacillaceae bacterium]